MFRITPEHPADTNDVEFLYDLAFAPGRMALSSYRLRDEVAPLTDLSRVARDDYDALVGAIRFWPVVVGAAAQPALLLGPIAVHPTVQGEGLGALLIVESLEAAAQAGWRQVLLVGDAPYYRRFGFARVDVEFPAPTNPERVLGCRLGWAGPDDAERPLSGAVDRWPAGRPVRPG